MLSLKISFILIIFSTITMCIAYICLNKIEKKDHRTLWILAWMINLIVNILTYSVLINYNVNFYEAGVGICAVIGAVLLLIGIYRLIKKRTEEKAFSMTYFNQLTGLPNRSAFSDSLSEGIYHASLNNRILAVLLLNLDGFRNINYTLGRDIGDKLIKNIAERLRDILPKGAILSHFGGDEFAVIINCVDHKGETEHIAQRITNKFQSPFLIDGYEVYITVSIGISIYPYNGDDSANLIKNAEIAMTKAKESVGDSYEFYKNDMKELIYDDFLLSNSLRHVIERNELILHYQPKTDIKTGEIAGLEALVRWKHNELGLIPPLQFISIAEETGIIIEIGEWVLKTACAQNVKWQNEGYNPLRVAVNISARQLQQSDFFDMIVRVLEETGLEPKYLELEITEGIAINNIKKTNNILRKLRELGVFVSLDDFGTGYSSLSCLNQISIDILKIDQSFIRNLELSKYDKELVCSIINMAHALDLKVTAEGVETESQIKFLMENECDFVQGYYYSKPVSDFEFQNLFLKNKIVC